MAECEQAWQEKCGSAARDIALTEDLDKPIAEPHRERALHRADAETFVANAVDVRERWEKPAIEQRRAAVRTVFRAVVIKPAVTAAAHRTPASSTPRRRSLPHPRS